jgi:NAD(P)H-hydrate epimerase
VKAFLCPPKKEGAKPAPYPDYFVANLDKAKAAGVSAVEAGPEAGLAAALAGCVVVLDALLGTGSAGKPAGAIHHMIQEITRSKKPVLALDVPSGIHPDTGYHSGVFVTAAETLTLGLPKRGLVTPHAARNVGVLKVLDIGYPAELLRQGQKPS